VLNSFDLQDTTVEILERKESQMFEKEENVNTVIFF